MFKNDFVKVFFADRNLCGGVRRIFLHRHTVPVGRNLWDDILCNVPQNQKHVSEEKRRERR